MFLFTVYIPLSLLYSCIIYHYLVRPVNYTVRLKQHWIMDTITNSVSSSQKPVHMKWDLKHGIEACRARGLLQSSKWLAELSLSLKCKAEYSGPDDSLPDTVAMDVPYDNPSLFTDGQEDTYTVAKSYFDLAEYDRAAFTLKDDTTDRGYFLHMYSRYLSALRRRHIEKIDDHSTAVRFAIKNEELRVLRTELSDKYMFKELDSFGIYLYGIIIKKLNVGNSHQDNIIEIFAQSVMKYPMHWGAWLELAFLITDQNILSSVSLPQHWMKDFFVAKFLVDLMKTDEPLVLYDSLKNNGFKDSLHIKIQIAMTHHNKRGFDESTVILEEVHKNDPYVIEQMDVLSNMYYVQGKRAELAHLAHHFTQVDKFRVETCCIVGNYYSIRCNHEKAVLYFQRALKLNPDYLGAWTLMGHEYTEVKNTPAAIQSYRNALNLNKRDYRAWYGLGQTYELLNLPSYAVYYYKQANKLRPFDSRMLMALGEVYEHIQKVEEAKMCYRKAIAVGDIEGVAYARLAKLYKAEDNKEWAAYCYEKFVQQLDEHVVEGIKAHSEAHVFLANYHLETKDFDRSAHYANKCCNNQDTREEGMAILRQISQIRGVGSLQNEEPSPIFGAQPTPSRLQDSAVAGMEGDSLVFAGPLKLTFSPGNVDSDTSLN